jgi:hypothetical protein
VTRVQTISIPPPPSKRTWNDQAVARIMGSETMPRSERAAKLAELVDQGNMEAAEALLDPMFQIMS